MIQIQHMKPFHIKLTGKELRLLFACTYFSINKDGEEYKFVPIEGVQMIINTDTKQIENMSEVFVFQNANKFIRMPLYQLLLVSNIHDFLTPIIEDAVGLIHKEAEVIITIPEVNEFIVQLENQNIDYYIDIALDNKDEELFNKMVEMKKELVAT